MRKALIALSALALSAGVASADHWRRPSTWSGGVSVSPGPGRVYRNSSDVIVNGGVRFNGGFNDRYDRGIRYEHRPIFMPRPVIRQRYYDYDQRPQVIGENYAPMSGYIWMPGAWQWSGYEWIWQPGHYEPDQRYQSSYPSSYPYSSSYSDPSYDNNQYNPQYNQYDDYTSGGYYHYHPAHHEDHDDDDD